MNSSSTPPASLVAFMQSAPAKVTRALTVLSVAVSLTDEVATELVGEHLPSGFEPEEVINSLRLCDFVIEPNGEWYLEPSARAFLLEQLRLEPELSDLSKPAHAKLRRLALEADPEMAGDTLPTYLTWPVGLAYHTVIDNWEQGLDLYRKAFTNEPTGEQWLLGILAEEQQQSGLLPFHVIEPSYFQGMTAYREGRWKDAERYFNRVIASQEDRQEVAFASHLLGLILHRRHHRDDDAEKLMKRSLKIGEIIGDSHHQAQVLQSLANLIKPQNVNRAKELLRRSLQIEERTGNLHGQAQVLQSLANILGSKQRDKAEALLRQSLEINERAGDLYGQAQVLHSLAILIAERNRKKAEGLMKQSLEIGKAIGNLHHQAQVSLSLADLIKKDRKRRAQAEEILWECLKLRERLGDLDGQARVLRSLALLIAARDFDEAKKLLYQSLAINDRLHHSFGRVQVLSALGTIHRRVHKWEEARSYYLQVLKQAQYPLSQSIAHLELSYIAEEHDKDVPSAIQHMKQAIALQRHTNRQESLKRNKARLRDLERRNLEAQDTR